MRNQPRMPRSARRRPRSRRRSRATTRGAPPSAPCASPRRCRWTAARRGDLRHACSRRRTSSRWSRSGGQPATEKTEVWLFFDSDNVYVSFRAWESQPDRTIANEMRRDSNNIRQGDSVGFSFDTFRDRRNAIQFEANSLGAPHRRAEHERAAVQRGLEPGLEARGRHVRRRLDDRGRDPVQVDPLRARHRAGLGIPGAPHEQVEERDRLPHETPAGVRHRPRRLLRVALRQRRRPRGAAAIAHARAEAVRDRRRDHRQHVHADARTTIPTATSAWTRSTASRRT